MARSGISPSEIVIEVATSKNSNVPFAFLGDAVLRGRWDPANVRMDWDDECPFRGLPMVPGMYVCLDLKKQTIRAVDPLSFAENAELLDRVKSCAKPSQGNVGPTPEVVLQNRNNTEIKTALWRMFEAVESKHAILIQGEFPKRDVILAMPGQLFLRTPGGERCYDPQYSLEKPLPPFAQPFELERMGATPETIAKAVAGAA